MRSSYTNQIPFILLAAVLISACRPAFKEGGAPANSNRIEFVPEPDKSERLRYEALTALKDRKCAFTEPDTSLSGMLLRDAESTSKFIGSDKPDENDQYHFYSNSQRESLTMTHHPGDGQHQISLFKVSYAGKPDHDYKWLPIESFETQNGIRLGLSKTALISKAGPCYASVDSSKDYIELFYRIEQPQDSRTGLLKRHNMPVYFASYIFRQDRLERFEFGFEYP